MRRGEGLAPPPIFLVRPARCTHSGNRNVGKQARHGCRASGCDMSVGVEYNPEFVKRAAADILAVRPAYADLIGFYGDIFAAQEQSRARVRLKPFLLPPELVRIKRKDQFPLIQVEEMRFDPEASTTLFKVLCRIAVERSSGLSKSAAALLEHLKEVVPLLQGFLLGDELRLKQAAAGFGADTESLSFFLYHSLRPSLCRCEHDLSGLIADDLFWGKGYCPICGSPPALARLESDGRRFLFCGFCWHRWPALRTACPFCSQSDPARLSYLYSEEEQEYRLDVCDVCRKYVKTVDSRQLARTFYPPLEQIASLHMDIKASEAGYAAGLPLALSV
jgi:FdhE protein